MTTATAVAMDKVLFHCVKCGRCNAGISGAVEAVRVFVRCHRCGEVTEAKAVVLA